MRAAAGIWNTAKAINIGNRRPQGVFPRQIAPPL